MWPCEHILLRRELGRVSSEEREGVGQRAAVLEQGRGRDGVEAQEVHGTDLGVHLWTTSRRAAASYDHALTSCLRGGQMAGSESKGADLGTWNSSSVSSSPSLADGAKVYGRLLSCWISSSCDAAAAHGKLRG